MREKDWIDFMREEQSDKENDPLSKYDIANFRKRNYLNQRDETISAKVRPEEKSKVLNKKCSPALRNMIRLLLIDDNSTIIALAKEHNIMATEDRNFILRSAMLPLLSQFNLDSECEELFRDGKMNELMKRLPSQASFAIAQVVKGLSRIEVMTILNLVEVASTRLNGYEKEIFWLRCAKNNLPPVILLRLGVRLLGNGYNFPKQSAIKLKDIRIKISIMKVSEDQAR